MDTPNAGIPYVPEDTQDPAAGLNLALNVIDALLQTAVISMALTAPPGSPADGDLYIVGASATGPWAGQDNSLARWVDEGDFWQFYPAGTRVKLVLNLADGGLYAWNGSAWVAPVAAGSVAADGVSYDNTASELDATDVQAALDEIAAALEAAAGTAAWGGLGGTLADQEDLQDELDSKAAAVIAVSTPANSSGTVTLDFAGKSKYIGAITLGENVTTLQFDNLPGAGSYAEYELHITQDGTGSRTFAIPASHKALGGSDTAIASAANAVTVLTASTVDNGTTWRYAMQESA